jgi:hypothetical protein
MDLARLISHDHEITGEDRRCRDALVQIHGPAQRSVGKRHRADLTVRGGREHDSTPDDR